MSESLRERMIEFHGREAGEQLYATALKNRAATERLSVLTAELDDVRRELSAKIKGSSSRLVKLQDAANRAYADWLAACNELECGKIELQQNKAQLRDQTEAILGEMKGRAPVDRGVNLQWHVPSWVRPESENKGDCGS